LNSSELRQRYLDFFAARGHLIGEPAPLVPVGDASVLFTTAGMQQYKPYYLGTDTPPSRRMTTAQRCFRTSDIENVGHTARHLTFFEMLGNFSFGDYFKKEAIAWSLEFSEELGVDRSRIWVTVFGGDDEVPADDEAIDLWLERGIPLERIVRLGRSDNFWGPAGPSGPCGPCSELYYDMGSGIGCGKPDCKPGCECDRYMEYWNLVFPQYNMDERGALTLLPKPSIDTGMGIERMAAITQGVTTVFESDAFDYLIAAGERLAGVGYGSSEQATRALRTMADHARSVAFLVMDGVLPGNEGRDYLLRRIIRRAVQQGVAVGLQDPFLAQLCDLVVERMGDAYPGLLGARAAIAEVAGEEERRFRHTLEQGLSILEEALRRARGSGAELPAEVAFELHDTYGFPFDLTREIALEDGMGVDEEQFERLMAEQRERARAAQKGGEFASGPSEVDLFQRDTSDIVTDFVGYEKLEVFTVVRACRTLSDGRVALKLAESPFYAEGGGQIADEGWIHTEEGAKLDVVDVVRFAGGQVIVARLSEGSVDRGHRAKAMVNAVRRHQTACNHTATHLLHNALRLLVDGSIRQAGSFVGPDKLRFDFAVRRAPTADELRQVEELVNRRIVENHPVRGFVTTRDYAAELGALAFFEEKYGESVRVLEIDDFSRELCGGTHVSSTSQIGLFKISTSQSVGANTRRIEAITSAKAIEHYRSLEETLMGLAADFKTDAQRVALAVRRQSDQLRDAEQRVKALETGEQRGALEDILAASQAIGGIPFVAAGPPIEHADDLLALADQIRERQPDSVVVLASEVDGKVAVVVAVGESTVGRGIRAGDILKAMMPALDGKGGGKPTLARGGGTNVAGIDQAMDAAIAKVKEALGA
jgi:alanyl-tRNA synthetase